VIDSMEESPNEEVVVHRRPCLWPFRARRSQFHYDASKSSTLAEPGSVYFITFGFAGMAC